MQISECVIQKQFNILWNAHIILIYRFHIYDNFKFGMSRQYRDIAMYFMQKFNISSIKNTTLCIQMLNFTTNCLA